MLNKLKQRAIESGTPASIDEAMALNESYSTDEMRQAADEIRKNRCGDEIHTCSIVNARSGKCGEDCKWCAQSAHHNTGIREYDYIPRKEMITSFENNKKHGVRYFSLVTSGRRVMPSQLSYFCRLYEEAAHLGGVNLCASMGLLDREELQQLWDAGVRTYHCNLETSPSYFPQLCSTHTIEDKLNTIKSAREIGFKICSGGIIGMGETLRNRLELIEMVRTAGASSIPINILIPIKGTPLENIKPLSEDEVIRTVALMRFIAPNCTIHFAGGRSQLSQQCVAKILRGGINGALVGDMLTTVGNKINEDYELFKEMGYRI